MSKFKVGDLVFDEVTGSYYGEILQLNSIQKYYLINVLKVCNTNSVYTINSYSSRFSNEISLVDKNSKIYNELNKLRTFK